MTTESDHRLPRTVVPRHYALTFTPDLESATFHGSEIVDVEVTEDTTSIVLNSIELDITIAAMIDWHGTRHEPTTVEYDTARQRATLRFDVPLEPGQWQLHATFDGILNDNLHGFYRSTYTDPDGETKAIATTQFEATDARRAFPCWDEPDRKATFGITLVVPEDLMAISNEGVISEEATGDARKRIVFADTMIMSTYLVAMIVGDLEATAPVDVDGVPLRIVHTPGKAHLVDFALDVGAFALRYFSDYYEIPYPGGKMDMIGIPDFAYGAMENLGAITYRETALLVDPDTATQAELARVADVIAHELAHMWFGDLVTMKWWNGIWLNEAFASFMETKCVDAFRPAWKRWLDFASHRSYSMDIDALASTRPIEFPVASPDEANQMFDVLTYGKGQAVLRMLETYLGEEVFRTGIAAYLAAHSYANTETSDLWAALEKVSGEPVGEIMEGWIFQGGFPRLNVAASGDGYVISQEQFRYLGEGDHRWRVPAMFAAETGAGRALIDGETALEAGDGLLLNSGGQGFYRVRYSAELLAGLIDRLPVLSADERYSVVADTWANVLAGDVAAADFVELVSGLGDETEPAVWGVALSGLTQLDRVISSDARPWLQRVIRDLIRPAADRMGWTPNAGESDLDRQLRGMLIGALGNLAADGDTLAVARDVFEQWLEDRASIDGDVGAAAMSVVASHGGGAEFDRLVERYKTTSNPQDQIRFLRAAVSVPDLDSARRAIDMVIAREIRSQDATTVAARLIGNREIGAGAWELVKDRWDEVVAAPPPQTARRLIDLISNRSEPEVAADIEAWLASHPLPGGEKNTAQQVERMRVRVGLRERESTRLGDAASQ